MAELVHIADPRPQRALHRAHRALELELRALLRPERAAAILEEALDKVIHDDGPDPARRLRSLVGARLLDEVADLLGRVGETIASDEAPTVSIPLDAPEPVRVDSIDERADRSRVRRRWSPAKDLTRRTG